MIGNYVFLIPSIVEVGGGEFYVANKAQYLNRIGYNVIIISTRKKKAVIPYLKQFEKYIWQELEYPISATPKRIVRIIEQRLHNIITNENIIFESNMVTLSPWGEYFAHQFQGLHIAYPLSEGFSVQTPSMKDFFEFKLNQHLLFGISKKSIGLLLGTIQDIENTCLPAVGCTYNQIQDLPLPESIKLEGFDYNILCLGRLSKSYVKAATKAVSKFADNYFNKRIQYIVVGGDCTNEEKSILVNMISNNKNVYGVFTGALSPLPLQLFNIANVAIASAGCVGICRRRGLLTISVDANDSKAIGIFNVTTNNSLYRNDEPKINIETVLEEVLVQKKYPALETLSEIEPDYSKHLNIINKQYDKHYYNVFDINNPIRYNVLKFLYTIFGFRIVKTVMDLYIRFQKSNAHCL